ncbi:hypothetical protein [Pseudomonas aeruginosa]|uniref:hypothetical protein n=1 Tax=Pseudomonas aeruginosa TaxID=287 RepID=UPI0010434A71|nr:hypothetical protein [Pseudomonas aeruginosa]
MNVFLAQIKHRLIHTKSENFTNLGNEVHHSFSVVKKFFFDTGFQIQGFADLDTKKYFFLSKTDKLGSLIELPISLDFISALESASDLEKQRVKKALKKEDLHKAHIEILKMLDRQCLI